MASYLTSVEHLVYSGDSNPGVTQIPAHPLRNEGPRLATLRQSGDPRQGVGHVEVCSRMDSELLCPPGRPWPFFCRQR